MALVPGQIIADYEILAELGHGGMGSVYQARQVSLQRIVALKVLPIHIAARSDSAVRFQTEAVATANLNHPNVVQVFAAGESNGIQFMAMEFVDGESIQQRIVRCGRLPMTESLDVAYHVTMALQHAWVTAHLIHRDVKPDNIFLAANGTVKLGDFGLAKFLGGAPGVTNTGHAMGTPNFISPEQAHGRPDIDFRADVYSLGCTLHYMMTGRMVFEGPDFLSTVLKHVNDEPAPLETLLPGCPPEVQSLLDRMLRKAREDRHQGYDELAAEILHAREAAAAWEADVAARRERIIEPPATSRWIYVVAAIMPFLVAAFLVVGKRAERSAPADREVSLADPSDRRDFIESVRDLPPVARVDSVIAKLREVNPQFRGNARYTVDGDMVAELSFSAVGVSNLWPIAALPGIRVLRCAGDAKSQQRGSIVDLSPLAELIHLEELDCSWNPVSDLQALRTLPLVLLRCANTRVEDLRPLEALDIDDLDISRTFVRDVAALRGMRLSNLRCQGTRIRELTPLRDASILNLWCEPRMLDQALVKSWHNLQSINGMPAAEFLKRYNLRRGK